MSDTSFIIPEPEHLREMRDQTVAAMHGMGCSQERKHLVADISVHATEEAMRAVSRVVDSAPLGTQAEVLAIALQLTLGLAGRLVGSLREFLDDTRRERQS